MNTKESGSTQRTFGRVLRSPGPLLGHGDNRETHQPTHPSLDMSLQAVPNSPPPPYSPLPQYSPRLEESSRQSSEPCRQCSFHPPSCAASPLPMYERHFTHGMTVFNVDGIYCHIGVAPVVERTPSSPGRLAVAASRESKGSKRQLKDYKSQPMSQVRGRVEELCLASERDEFACDVLEEILAIGETHLPTTRAAFLNAALGA
ncbi:unnamed protein product [Rhizoctonia solani]|uniref:Uncharacterized protein n=1 Tax=Rhizoctonia solani TaxID=456999 RepID=A0A8H3BJR2_9AGAM|nr:unnamed protein product [Rhizoctonia solani]